MGAINAGAMNSNIGPLYCGFEVFTGCAVGSIVMAEPAGATPESCPDCGSGFETRHALRTHHGRMHDGTLDRVEVSCERCGDAFQVIKSRTETATFCSTECKKDQVTISCEWCGDEFSVAPSREDTARFCSTDCKGNWIGADPDRIAIPIEKSRVEKVCDYCGTEYEVQSYRASENRFCSADCQNQWMSQEYPDRTKGADNPNWKRVKAGVGYQAVRQLLPGQWKQLRKEHTADSCAACGATETLELHHIVPVLAGGLNEPWNLLTLCRECHQTAEAYTREVTERPLLRE